MKRKPKLKPRPCPICGGKAIISPWRWAGDGVQYTISCARPNGNHVIRAYGPTPEAATALWKGKVKT